MATHTLALVLALALPVVSIAAFLCACAWASKQYPPVFPKDLPEFKPVPIEVNHHE